MQGRRRHRERDEGGRVAGGGKNVSMQALRLQQDERQTRFVKEGKPGRRMEAAWKEQKVRLYKKGKRVDKHGDRDAIGDHHQ